MAPAPIGIELTPLRTKVMRALAAATIDPGELTWTELVDRCSTSTQALAGATNWLADRGLVVQDDWNGSTYDTVRVTDAGAALCNERGFAWAVRS